MGKPVVYFGFPTSQFQACVCVTPGNVIQAYVWADSSLQHFVKGASGMHAEISYSSACPWSKGQNESLLQLSSVTFTAVCVQPLVTKEDQSPYAEVSLCEPHLVPSWEAGHLWVTRTVSQESYEESPDWTFTVIPQRGSGGNPVSCMNSVCVVLGSSQSRPPLHMKWHQTEAVALIDYMWEGEMKNIL